jgi:hypothetical protein
MIERIRKFWIHSYQSDRVSFYVELLSFVFTVSGSVTLAISAKNPNMALVYPLFFIGSISQFYASMRRGMAWATMLTGYFAVINVFGFGRAVGWW